MCDSRPLAGLALALGLCACSTPPDGYPALYAGATELRLTEESGARSSWSGGAETVVSPVGESWLLTVGGSCVLTIRPFEDYVDHGYVPMEVVGEPHCSVEGPSGGVLMVTWGDAMISWFSERMTVFLRRGDATWASDGSPAGELELDYDGTAVE